MRSQAFLMGALSLALESVCFKVLITERSPPPA